MGGLCGGEAPDWWGGTFPSQLNRRLAVKYRYASTASASRTTGKLPISVLEALAVLSSLWRFPRRLAGRRVLFFIDNLTAFHVLRRGRSRRSVLLGCIANVFWARSFDLGVSPVFLWVPSRFNPADPPSRGHTPPLSGSECGPPSSRTWRGIVDAVISAATPRLVARSVLDVAD